MPYGTDAPLALRINTPIKVDPETHEARFRIANTLASQIQFMEAVSGGVSFWARYFPYSHRPPPQCISVQMGETMFYPKTVRFYGMPIHGLQREHRRPRAHSV